MNFQENIRIALFSIRTNLMRSLLTMLGIIIGVASVIAIITLGQGGRDFIVGMIRDMGQSVVNISVNTAVASNSDYITKDDVQAIKDNEAVQYISPVVMNFGSASTQHAEGFAMVISGTTDLQQVASLDVQYGTFFSQDEYQSAAYVAVIDAISAKTMFGYTNVVGEYMEVGINDSTVRLRIVGVVDMQSMMSGMDTSSSENMMSEMFGTGMGNSCLIAVPSTLTDIMTGNSGRYEMCYLTAVSEDLLDAAGNVALNILHSRHQNYDAENPKYSVVNMATFIDLLDTVINVFTTFIAAVSAISLLVGGIGVMNIMLVSVTERTREIGIRKSLGAKTRTILFQFLTESVILCFIGGVIGLVLGVTGAGIVAWYINIPISLKFSTVAIAVGFSSAIGIFFGIYPAKRAADMHPIEALRRE